MASRYPPVTDEEWLRQGSPSGLRCQSLTTVLDIAADLAALTTQVMTSVYLPLQPSDYVTNLTFVSGATAAGTPTNYWFALYDAAGTLLGQSADQLTAAWAANTVKTLALATPARVPTAGAYAAVMVKATTVPTLIGCNLALAVAAGSILSSKVIAQTSGSALVATAPGTIATPTTVATVPLAIAT